MASYNSNDMIDNYTFMTDQFQCILAYHRCFVLYGVIYGIINCFNINPNLVRFLSLVGYTLFLIYMYISFESGG